MCELLKSAFVNDNQHRESSYVSKAEERLFRLSCGRDLRERRLRYQT